MSILEEFDFENVPELAAVPEDEYEVRIIDAGPYVSKSSGKQMIRLVLEIQDQPNADNIYHYMGLPQQDDDERRRNTKLRRLKEFLGAFGIDQRDEFVDWIGKAGWALIGVEVDEQSGLNRNTIKRFILPR